MSRGFLKTEILSDEICLLLFGLLPKEESLFSLADVQRKLWKYFSTLVNISFQHFYPTKMMNDHFLKITTFLRHLKYFLVEKKPSYELFRLLNPLRHSWLIHESIRNSIKIDNLIGPKTNYSKLTINRLIAQPQFLEILQTIRIWGWIPVVHTLTKIFSFDVFSRINIPLKPKKRNE